MLKKKFYDREEVENLYRVYSEKVKQHSQIVEDLNKKIRSSELSPHVYKSRKAVVDEFKSAQSRLERTNLILNAVVEIAQDVISGEIVETFNSEVLAKFAGKSCGEKTCQKFRTFVCDKYGIEYTYLSCYGLGLEWGWNNHNMSLYASEQFVDGNNKFRASVNFGNFKARQFPDDLEEWADAFLAKKEEHENLLKELDEKIKVDCEELEIGLVQLPHIQIDALK